MQFAHKLHDIPTTIFSVISRRARELGALNVGQGFPDYPIDPALAQCVTEAMAAGHNQYAPMEGSIVLREAISRKLRETQGVAPDPDAEITVTCGGTEALHSAIQAIVRTGDEVICFDPAYDAYEPAVQLTGGRCIRIPSAPPGFRPDWDRFRDVLSDRTRLVITNNPHNPACIVWTAADLDTLADLIRERPILVLADEVYEHLAFGASMHRSVLAHPELASRSLAVFSFGKTFHVTGWRVGYCVASRELTHEFRKVHQFNTFSIAAPLQQGIATYLAERPDAWRGLAEFFRRKRDLVVDGLHGTAYAVPPAQGTYFQLLDCSAVTPLDDVAFAERLLMEAGVALIPLSPFYARVAGVAPRMTWLRMCIAKRDETLQLAVERLRTFAERSTVVK